MNKQATKPQPAPVNKAQDAKKQAPQGQKPVKK